MSKEERERGGREVRTDLDVSSDKCSIEKCCFEIL